MSHNKSANYRRNRRQLRKRNGGCYIATAIYGSYNCPQVWVLRRYRDQQLEKTWWGRVFISLYYCVSPSLVNTFGKTSVFNRFFRSFLDKMVIKLKEQGVSDKPYQDI